MDSMKTIVAKSDSSFMVASGMDVQSAILSRYSQSCQCGKTMPEFYQLTLDKQRFKGEQTTTNYKYFDVTSLYLCVNKYGKNRLVTQK